MNHIASIIAASARLSLGYAERLAKDVPSENFGRLAQHDGKVIEANHPSFICGHLCLYSPRIVAELGGDASAITPPSHYADRFSKDHQCLDDPSGNIYPAKDELLETLASGYHLAIETIEQQSDETFARPNANEAMRSRFPTVGAMHAFYTGGHFMIHMGQWSTWRRVMGFGPA
ncbi:MAG: DinB family protein [Planctomycetota bacterium]